MTFFDNLLAFLQAYSKKKQSLVMTAISLSLCYFIFKYIRKTKLRFHFSNEKFRDFITSAPSLKSQRFYPFPFLSFAFGQCLLAGRKYEDDRDLVQTRESFRYSNGGSGHVEWVTFKSKSQTFNPNIIAFILPGLCSKPTQPYLRDLYTKLLNNGIRTVVFVPRFNDDKFTIPETGTLNLVDDVHAGVLHVLSKYPEAKLIGIGHSYGANGLVNYLGFHNEHKHFIAGISIANPYDFTQSSKVIQGTIVEKYLMSGIKDLVKASLDTIHQGKERFKWTLEEILATKQLREFDDMVVAKVMGFDGASEYYDKISSEKRVWRVRVPLLSINSEDDPFIEFKGVPVDAHTENENLLFLITKRGAHIGWIEGIFKLQRWYLSVTIDFIKWISK